MNCEAFRYAVGADPKAFDAALDEHAVTCSECARYRQELRDMDRVIERALTIRVPAVPRPARTHTTRWAMAASLLGAAILTAALWLAQPQPSLAKAVAEHARGEASALVSTSQAVDTAALTDVLQAAGVRLRPGGLLVSYAMSCSFRGHHVPHLVVQTADGPVTVLVLRHETAEQQAREFEEEGFRGVIVPAQDGALAVLSRGIAVMPAARAVQNALEYAPAK